MKRGIIMTLLVFVSMMLILVVPLAAAPLDTLNASDPLIPMQAWTLGPPSPFEYTRFDGVFVPGVEPWGNKVYFLGGRSGSATEDSTVWMFDPVTGIYTDTGADIVEDVSNYTASLIEDDGTGRGPAVYMIGGYDADNTVANIGTVQRYYPQSNLAEALPPADDWIVMVADNLVTAMGNAAVGNVIYVFGGWENITAPYFYNGTWVFDPSQPSGSRWTDLGLILSPGRSYIQVAIQSSIIYAMGGIDQYVGGDLVPTTIVEKLDTTNLSAGWTVSAPMPVASAEGRGFGFDHETVGVNEPWTGLAYVVGGGDWSESSAEAMEYLIGTDSWDQGFADLLNARRDHAGVFIPICTEDPNDGLPGMWVFGGHTTSDSPPFGPTEFYPMSCTGIPQVMLIPSYQDGSAIPGATAVYTVTLSNQIGFEDTFNIGYSSVFTITGPSTLGPVPNGSTVDFQVEVEVPSNTNCFEADLATITAEADSDPIYTDTAEIQTSVAPAGVGTLQGTISDSNTDLGIENAYFYINLGDQWYEAYTDPVGSYSITPVNSCEYVGLANAFGYFDKYGLPVNVTIGAPTTYDISLDASMPVLTGDPVSVVVLPDSTDTYNLTLNNKGTGELNFYITEVPSGTYPLPLFTDLSMPKGVDPQVYSDIAAAPDGTTKFIVYMQQQAELSAAYNMNWNQRGEYVLDTLRDVADKTQANLQMYLNQKGVSYESRYIVNALVVDGSLSLVNELASRPEVGFIGPNEAVPAPNPVSIDKTVESPEAIEWNILKITADQVWSGLGITGGGIRLSNMDTGVQWDHPALINQYRGWDGAVADHNYNWWDPYNQNTTEPTDADGHGTHTMGTMLGSDDPTDPINAANAIGVAPGAQWLACDGFDNNTGYGYDVELLECAEFLLAPWDLTGANPDPDMRPDIINNSWGGGQAQWWYNQAIYAWRAAGIMGVFSIGNAGSECETAGSPGDNANMLGVGATTSTDLIASFSSRGPAAVTGLTKPNVSAPGANIRSSVPGNNYEGGWSGTSMAAPHVAGTVALIWSAVPELRGDVQLTSWIIEQTAFGITTSQGCGGDLPDEIPNNVYGWGRINAYDAVSMAMAADWDTPWLEFDPFGGTIAPGASQNITLTFDTTGLVFGECYISNLKFEYNDPYVTEEFVPVEVCIGIPIFNINLPIIFR